MCQMSHENWLTFYFLGINLIFDIFLIFSDLTTSIPKKIIWKQKTYKTNTKLTKKSIKNTI